MKNREVHISNLQLTAIEKLQARNKLRGVWIKSESMPSVIRVRIYEDRKPGVRFGAGEYKNYYLNSEGETLEI